MMPPQFDNLKVNVVTVSQQQNAERPRRFGPR
jgi:small subunit ribosomal protein S17e